MPGRYTGVVGRKLTGDRQRAAELLPLARKLAQQALEKVASFGGSGTYTVSEIAPGGSRVVAWVAVNPPNPPIVRVWVRTPIEKPGGITDTLDTFPRTLTWFAEGFSITPQTAAAPMGWGLPRLDASGNPINSGKGTPGGAIRDVLINNFRRNGYPGTPDQPVEDGEKVTLIPYTYAPLLATTDWPHRAQMTATDETGLLWFCHWMKHATEPSLSKDIRVAINDYRAASSADLDADYRPILGYYRHFAELWIFTNTPDYDDLFPLIAHQDDLFPDRLHAIHNRGNRCGRYAFADYSEIILLGASDWTAQDRVDMWKTSYVHNEDMLWPHTEVKLNNIHPHIDVVRAAADPKKQSPCRAAFSEVATGSKDGQSLSVRTIDVRDKFVETGNLYWSGTAGTVSWYSPFGSKHHLYPLTETVDDPDTGDPSVADLSKYYAYRGGQVMSHAKPYFLYRGHASGIPEELVTVKLGASGTEADTIWPHTTTWVVIGACLLDEPVQEPDLSELFDDLPTPPSDPLDPIKLKFALVLYLNVITGELRLYKGSVSRFEVAKRLQTLAAPDFYQPMTDRNEFYGGAGSGEGLVQYQKHCAHDILGISACTFNSTGTEGVFAVHRIDHNLGVDCTHTSYNSMNGEDTFTSSEKLHIDAAPQGSRIEFYTVTEGGFTLETTSTMPVTPTVETRTTISVPPTDNILDCKRYALDATGAYKLFADYDSTDVLTYATVTLSFSSANGQADSSAEGRTFSYTGTLTLPCGTLEFVNTDAAEPFVVNLDHINLFDWSRCVYTRVKWSDVPAGTFGGVVYATRSYTAKTYIGNELMLTHDPLSASFDVMMGEEDTSAHNSSMGVARDISVFSNPGWDVKWGNPNMFWAYPGYSASWYNAQLAFMASNALIGEAAQPMNYFGRSVYNDGTDAMIPSLGVSEPIPRETFNAAICPFAPALASAGVNHKFHVAFSPYVALVPPMISGMARDPRDVVGGYPGTVGTGFIQEIEYNDDWILAGWIGNPLGLDLKADGGANDPYHFDLIEDDGTPWLGSGYPRVRLAYEDHAASVSTFGTDRCFWRSSLDLEAIVGEGELINILPIGVA